MKHGFSFFCFHLILWAPLLGNVAAPDPIVVFQPDGQPMTVYIKGDERQGWVETLAGHTIIKNKETGFWEYAVKGKAGRLVTSGLRVEPGTAPAPFSRGLKPAKRDIHVAGVLRNKAALWDPQHAAGDRPLLVILVSFQDRSFQTPPQQWSATIFDTTPGVKSVANFYEDNSFGKLTILPVAHTQGGPAGIVSVTLNRNHPNYGNGDGFDSVREQNNEETSWINEAMQLAAPFVNFAQYDKDNDGALRQNEFNPYFVLAGYDASTSSNEPNIWAHAWSVFFLGQVKAGTKNLLQWAVQGELNHADAQFPMGVTAHELGHSMFNLPDLYDTAGVHNGFGAFSLMGSGAHGNTPNQPHNGMTPAALDAWCRFYLGWTQPRIPQHGERLEFPSALSAADSAVMLRHPELGDDEYFLVENRTPDFWDAGIEDILSLPTNQLRDENTAYATFPFVFAPVGGAEGVAVDCGLGKLGDFPVEVQGQIALILRGELSFKDKVLNAKAAGALGAIIYNNEPGRISRGTLGTAGDYIPVVGVAGEDGPKLKNARVTLEIKAHPWQGGLLVIHVDETNGPRINDSEENEHIGVMAVEASNIAGSLLDDSSSGHITHLFFEGNVDTFSALMRQGSFYHNGLATGASLTGISPPGTSMSATFTQVSELTYTIPWVVNNTQWLSRLAFFNAGSQPDTATLAAVTTDGARKEIALPLIEPGGVYALDSNRVFGDLSGYSLFVYGSDDIYPSFLTYNLEAASGRSPAQTTGLPAGRMTDTLLFGYLQSLPGGAAAVVLVAPEKEIEEATPVNLALYGPNGMLIENRLLELAGAQPIARVLTDLFEDVPEDATVKAQSNDGALLAGTTFVFNSALEPAMALPFPEASGFPRMSVIPWVVNNAQWSSRVALFNPGSQLEEVQLLAIGQDGARRETQVLIPGEAVFAAQSSEIFPDLSGYSLYVHGQQSAIFPSFQIYNLTAASGFSPAQTTGQDLDRLTSALTFPYLQTTAGGVSAIVLTAPETEDGVEVTVSLSLHLEGGPALDTTTVTLRGGAPFARVVDDLFSVTIPENASVVARATDGDKLAGTTFVFNGMGEPSMSVPFSTPAD